MRIGMVVWNDYWPDRRVHTEARVLRELGHDVEVVALRPSAKKPEREVMEGVPVHRVLVPPSPWVRSFLSPLFYTKAAPVVVSAVRKGGYDVLHVHDLDGLYVGVQVAKRTGNRLVWDAHEADYGGLMAKERGVMPRPMKYHLTNAMERRYAPYASHIIVNNPYNTSKSGYGKPVTSVPFRADPRFFSAGTLAERAPKPHGTYIGKIDEKKGAHLMLDTWAILRGRGRDVTLQMAGRLSSKVDIEALIRDRDLEGIVSYTPWVPYAQVPALVRRSWFGFSLLDPKEYAMHLPNKLMDYLACGVPVVASALPSQRELLDEYRCGAVVEELEPEQVANAVEEVLDLDPREAREEALRASRERFAWQDVEDALAEVHGQPVSAVHPA